MARQIFTILMFLVAGLFLMQTCKGKEGPPPALRSFKVVEPQAEDLHRLAATVDGVETVVLFDGRGAITDLTVGGETIVRTVPAYRRPLNVMLRMTSGATRSLAATGWEKADLPDGGFEFVHTAGQRTIAKRVRLDGKTGSLSVSLSMSGADETVRGLELTGPSGVILGSDDLQGSSVALLKTAEKSRMFTFDACVEYQRERRSRAAAEAAAQGKEYVPNYSRRVRIERDQTVERCGVLGARWFLGFAELPKVDAINFDAYRASRDGDETDEIETWISLTADPSSGYEGEFRFGWIPRALLDLPELKEQGSLEAAATHWLENETFKAQFTGRGGALVELWLKKFTLEAGKEPSEDNWVPILRKGVRPGGRALTLRENTGLYGLDPANRIWKAEVDSERDEIRFELVTPTGWRLEKVVTLPEPDRYDLGVELTVRPPVQFAEPTVRYTLIGPAGSYVEDAYRGGIGVMPPRGMILERRGGDNDDSQAENLEKEGPLRRSYGATEQDRGLLRAVVTRGSYFTSALITEERVDEMDRPLGFVTEAQVRAIELAEAVERPNGDLSRSSLAAQVKCVVPVREGAARASVRLYAGPNETDSLRPLRIEDTVEFGMFGSIGRALMWLIKFLQGLVGNYGVAIMLMTLIVRGLLFPVSYRTQLGMQRYSKRLQKIKPELDALQKKYGDNKDKLNRERMRVMREHKVGFPLGCLTIFIQMPIWFALFQALREEFALRHQNFLWAQDLSMPDHLFALPFWPHWFNLLPCLMLVLWVMQQKLTPTPGAQTDPNVQMQMKMVKWMPYVFFFMLYNYAAALALYMCVSSAWGIAESKLVRRAVARLD